MTLLEINGRLEPGQLTRMLQRDLAIGDAASNANLIAGLFTLHRSSLVRNRTLIAAVTTFLLGLDLDVLMPLLPALRRSLGNLAPAERAYLSETLALVLGGVEEKQRRFDLSGDDLALLEDANATVAGMLTTWEDRFGIR
jgi:hypothetical protein